MGGSHPSPFPSSAACTLSPSDPHPIPIHPSSNRAYLLVVTPEAAELYATRRADFARDDQVEGEVEGSGGSEGALAAMRAALMDPLQVRLGWVAWVAWEAVHAAVEGLLLAVCAVLMDPLQVLRLLLSCGMWNVLLVAAGGLA